MWTLYLIGMLVLGWVIGEMAPQNCSYTTARKNCD